MKLLILSSIFILLLSIGMFTESEATQCLPRLVRMEDFKVHGDRYPVFSPHDSIRITGVLVNLADRNQTINFGIHSTNIFDKGWFDGLDSYCGVAKGFFQTFGNEGEHFEIISVRAPETLGNDLDTLEIIYGTTLQSRYDGDLIISPIHLEPNEKRFVVIKLKPLKAGMFYIKMLKDNLHEPENQFHGSTAGHIIFSVLGGDKLTIYDIIIYALIGISITVQGVGISIMSILVFGKIKFSKFRAVIGISMIIGGLIMLFSLLWRFGTL